MVNDILDDPKLGQLDLADQMVFIRLLALLSRVGNETGEIELSHESVAMLCRRRFVYAKPVMEKLAGTGLVLTRYRRGTVAVSVPKWAEIQGFSVREEKIREELYLDGEKEKKPARRSSTPFPSDGLPEAKVAEVALKLGLSSARMAEALEGLRDWASAGDHRRKDWIAQLRSGIRKGWVFDATPRPNGSRPESAGDVAQRMIDELDLGRDQERFTEAREVN